MTKKAALTHFQTQQVALSLFYLQVALEIFISMQIYYPEKAAWIKILISKYCMSTCFSPVLWFFSRADFTCQKKHVGIW